jgi:hypothetical protein
MVLSFFDNERQYIKRLVDFANHNIFQLDDVLDMMNNEIATPGEDSRHTVVVGHGRWICYFIVDHPNKGRCHYFQIKSGFPAPPPDKEELDYIVKEFGIQKTLLEKHISVDNEKAMVSIVLPFD